MIGVDKEKRDLRELKDTLPMALCCCKLRFKRTGDKLSVGEMARYGLELLYASEVEFLRLREGRVDWDIEEVPQKL